MIVKNEIYQKYVTEDLINHKGLLHPMKTPFFEHIKTKQIDPTKLHPNPEDEFSMETVGPNWEIIGNYEKSIRLNMENDRDIFEEPLMAVKLDKGGYMLLNGHHRWMAALNLRVKKVPVKITDITTEDEVSEVINKSSREKCVTIDLDEVLLTDSKPKFPYTMVYKINIRNNASLLVRELHRMGYDVWIYTGSYMSQAYIKGLFTINNCSVDGIVNGINAKRKSVNLKEIFRSKYKNIIHVDNEAITSVNTETKDYEIIDLNATADGWAAGVVEKIHKI